MLDKMISPIEMNMSFIYIVLLQCSAVKPCDVCCSSKDLHYCILVEILNEFFDLIG